MPKQRRSQPVRPQPTKKTAADSPVEAASAARTAKPAKPQADAGGQDGEDRPRPAEATQADRAKPRGRRSPPPSRRSRPAGHSASARRRQPGGTKPGGRPPDAPVGPSSHDLAVEAFERGFQALQQRQFGPAAELLCAPSSTASRTRRSCRSAPGSTSPSASGRPARESRSRGRSKTGCMPATVAVNRGAFDEALALLRKLESDDPGNDHVQYMLSVIYTAIGDAAQALAHLRNAIELCTRRTGSWRRRTRISIPLRQDPGFAALAERARRRTSPRGRRPRHARSQDSAVASEPPHFASQVARPR